MPATIDYKALHASLCRFLPKVTGDSWDSSRVPGIINIIAGATDAGETVLRVHYKVSEDPRDGMANVDVPLAFAFGESGLAELLNASEYHDRRFVIARAIAYIESKHLGGTSSAGK